MKQFLILLFFCTTLFSKANPGDTTWVNVHNKTQMVWYERYASSAVLPDGSKEYHKILMYFTLGCANGGCSDWDYTVRFNVLRPTGVLDSNVLRIDTISQNPLVLDTVWNVFEVKDRLELARIITPYGNGLANNWEHDFVYDVTDYYPLLKDSIETEVFYQGWSSGFSATINLAFIEGPRPREVYSIENVYMGNGNYLNSSDFENQHLPSKTVSLNSNAAGLYLKANFSGHGFVNAINCAEFCEKDYYVKVNGQTVATQSMWRDDCGLNPIFPQGGTWLYDRANWCPGDKSLFRTHDLSNFAGNNTLNVDVDIESYSYSVPSGQVPANYNYAVQLIQHSIPTFIQDAELEKIVAPSNEDAFGRLNPICKTAVVQIRNKGLKPLNSCTIKYGIKGQAWHSYTWQGSLGVMESELVELPFGTNAQDWWNVTGGSDLEFEARVEMPNGVNDQNALNDVAYSTFTAPEVLPGKLLFNLRTNNVGSDTHWELTAADGTLLYSGDNLSANTLHTTNFSLSDGCYVLSIKDRSKNGLSFFANNDGSGSIQLKNDGGNFFFKNLQSNFGTELNYRFTVGYQIGLKEKASPTYHLEVYPNPAKDNLNLQLIANEAHNAAFYMYNSSGLLVKHLSFNKSATVQETISLTGLAKGLYTTKVVFGKEVAYKKVMIL